MKAVARVLLNILWLLPWAGPAADPHAGAWAWGQTQALQPQEVLVVANANTAGSEALGRYYCLARNILPERLLVLRTTNTPIVGRAEYNANIRDPIRKHLSDNDLKDRTRCLALVYGVPVRVLGAEPAAAQRELLTLFKAEAARMEGRLAIDLELLKTVCVSFPQPKTDVLTSVSELFDPRTSPVNFDPGNYKTLMEKFSKDLPAKESVAAALPDARQRQIALRQLAALRLDVLGMTDLAGHLPRETVSAVPDKDAIGRMIGDNENALKAVGQMPETTATGKQALELVMKARGLAGVYEHSQGRVYSLDPDSDDASVDSELALLWEEGEQLKSYRPNPMFWRNRTMPVPGVMPKVLVMTARLDGPSAKDALRMLKDGLEAEKTGLTGTFYIDAGGKYPAYEPHFQALADFLKTQTKFPCKLDTAQALFAPKSAPDAALYVGWYSLRNYVPAFTWVKGSVGWHVASFEAEHLRDPTSNEWCIKMIQNGVAATLGAVNEPLLGTFPLPEDFFPLLLTGDFSIADCYWRTVPCTSWRLTLIADPLYNPFKLHPQVSVRALPPGLVPPARRMSTTTTATTKP